MVTPLACAFALATLVSGVNTVLAWRRRRGTPAAVALTVTLAGCAGWSLAAVFQALGLSTAVATWAVRLSYLPIYLVVIGLFGTAMTVLNPGFRPRRALQLAIGIPPLLMLPVILFAPVPGVFFSRVSVTGSPAYPHVSYGPLFWVHTAFCYAILGSAYVWLLRGRRSQAAVFRTQIDSLLVAGLVPIAGNIVVLAAPDLFDHRDVVPLLFTVTALINSRAILRQGLLQIIPVARAQVLESISDSVLVIDAQDRIVDANAGALELLRRRHPELTGDIIGSNADEIDTELTRFVSEMGRRTVELLPGYHADLRTTPLTDHRGRLLGNVLVCHDISDLVAARTELEEQLALIRTLQQELLEQTVRDPLTGLHNRRHLTEELPRALAEADRSGLPVALLIVDVDHFKAINDRYGHPEGDRVLITIGQSLATSVRAGDTVARSGGEEFVVLLPGAARADALRRADQIRQRCATTVVGTAPGAAPTAVTVSIGVAVYHSCDDGADVRGTDVDATRNDSAGALIGAADQALYVAKATGRNRVCAAGEEIPLLQDR